MDSVPWTTLSTFESKLSKFQCIMKCLWDHVLFLPRRKCLLKVSDKLNITRMLTLESLSVALGQTPNGLLLSLELTCLDITSSPRISDRKRKRHQDFWITPMISSTTYHKGCFPNVSRDTPSLRNLLCLSNLSKRRISLTQRVLHSLLKWISLRWY